MRALHLGRFTLRSHSNTYLVILPWAAIKSSGLQISHLQNKDENSPFHDAEGSYCSNSPTRLPGIRMLSQFRHFPMLILC